MLSKGKLPSDVVALRCFVALRCLKSQVAQVLCCVRCCIALGCYVTLGPLKLQADFVAMLLWVLFLL